MYEEPLETEFVKNKKDSAYFVKDTGYTSVCPLCCARFGSGKTGVRCLLISLCDSCNDRKANAKLELNELWFVNKSHDLKNSRKVHRLCNKK
jgi:hypothetical protein